MKQKFKLTDQYNKTSVNKKIELRKGDRVWVQDINNKMWSKGVIVKVLLFRSYLVIIDKTIG